MTMNFKLTLVMKLCHLLKINVMTSFFKKINVITNNVWNDVMGCVGREHAWSRGREKRLKPTGGV